MSAVSEWYERWAAAESDGKALHLYSMLHKRDITGLLDLDDALLWSILSRLSPKPDLFAMAATCSVSNQEINAMLG